MAFAVPHQFWTVVSSFSLVFRKFLISSLMPFLPHSLFNSMVFNLHEFECFGFIFLRFLSSFSPLWSEKMLDNDFNFLELVEACFVSYHVVYLLKCSMCIWKECGFCFFGMKSSLYISVKSTLSRALFNATICLLIYFFEDLSFFDSGVLKNPLLPLCWCQYLSWSLPRFFLCIWVLLCWVHIYLQCLCLLGGFFFWVYKVTFLVSLYGPFFEVYFVWYEYCYACFFSLSICLEYLFLALHFLSV